MKPILKREPELPAQQTIWTKGFISIFFTSLALNMGIYMCDAMLSLYADSLGASVSAIGMLMSFFAVSSIAFRFVSAPVMDTYNRKYVVVFASLVLSAAFFGYSISNNVALLLGFRLLQGCGMAFGNACCLAIVADMLPKEKYSSGIGYYSLSQVISQASGPTIGLFLIGRVGYPITFVAIACILLAAAILATRIKIGFSRTKKLKLSLNNIVAKEALLPAMLMFLVGAGVSSLMSFLILFARTKGVVSNIGLFFTVNAVTMLVTRPLIGKLTDRFGFVKVIVPSLLCCFATFYIVSFSASLWGFLLAAFISAFGIGACQPALQSPTMKSVTNERRGVASSTNFIGLDLGALAGPAIAGAAVQVLGYIPMWHIMSIFSMSALTITVLFRKKITAIEKDF